MRRSLGILLVPSTLALAGWMFYFLPGWVGILVGAGLLVGAVTASVLLLLGATPGRRVGRLWKEFLDALYGL
jgi:hypothetical protein